MKEAFFFYPFDAQLQVLILAPMYLLLPGYLLIRATGNCRYSFLLSYSLSLGLLVLSASLVLTTSKPNEAWFGLTHLVLLGLGVIVARISPRLNLPSQEKVIGSKCDRFFHAAACIACIVSFGLYHYVAGPFTEIPSDFWKHLARVQTEFALISGGESSNYRVLDYLFSGSKIIYLLNALLASAIGVSPLDIVPAVTAVNSIAYLISVYCLSTFVYSRFFVDTRWVSISAAIATTLTLVTFGTATFSFVRYYAYFPTILAFPLVYASITAFADYLEHRRDLKSILFWLPLFFLISGIVHQQEALFIVVILGGMSLVSFLRDRKAMKSNPFRVPDRSRSSSMFFLLVFGVTAIYGLVTRDLIEWHHTPHVIDIGQYLRPLKNLVIDNPTFRLWDTVGFFGIAVYLWALVRWRTLLQSNYLTAGLLVPFFTNLNPLYTMIYLHFGPPTGLWRTAYLIPFPIISGLLIGQSLQHIHKSTNLWRKIPSLTGISLLLFALLPWSIYGYHNRTSRIPSLVPVDHSSGARLWGDLIHAIRIIESSQPIRRILTDQTTKFVLYAANRGQIWWWPEHEYFPKHINNYKDDWRDSDFTDTLLVWNERNGKITDNARLAGHWPRSILKTEGFYPADLNVFLSNNPDFFKLIWESNKIRVYRMSPSSD